MQNYTKIRPKKKLLNILGPFDYEIFVGQLEEDRHISNALLFGNRVSFFPSKNFNISLLRVAQFGGDNRNINSRTIKNMLLGKDNTNRNLSYSDQPGNQIAGIDFVYSD